MSSGSPFWRTAAIRPGGWCLPASVLRAFVAVQVMNIVPTGPPLDCAACASTAELPPMVGVSDGAPSAGAAPVAVKPEAATDGSKSSDEDDSRARPDSTTALEVTSMSYQRIPGCPEKAMPWALSSRPPICTLGDWKVASPALSVSVV